MNQLGLPGHRPSLFPGRWTGQALRQGNSTMAEPTSHVGGDSPSLVEVFKKLAYEWRSLFERARAIPTSTRGDEQSDAIKCDLADKHFLHPIYYLIRLIEEHTGITRETLESLAWRINSSLGAAPLRRTPPPRNRDPLLDDFFPTPPMKDLPDLRPVVAQISACDINGTTGHILRRFWERHPSLKPSLGAGEQDPVLRDPSLGMSQRSTKAKRSTHKGDARTQIIGKLLQHHGYNKGDSGVENRDPIGVGELARTAHVVKSTVSEFFRQQFKGHNQYQAMCRRNSSELAATLKLLDGGFAPHQLYDRTPPGEGQQDDR
jgi:hypothetical protein